MNLSVGIITFNEEKDLPRTLEAIKDIADEIIIVDSGSTDKTIEIAQSYKVQTYKETWKGFGLQKNSVIEKCNGKWILLIDADEEISPELKNEIKRIISNPNPTFKVYELNFTTFCFGKKINHGGWSNFYRIRLFLKGSGQYDDRQVHENFITSEFIGKIKEKINHYSYNSIEDYLNKLNYYTTQSAEHFFRVGKKKSPIAIYLSASLYFFKSYILQLGFLDGYEGYLLAKLGSMTTLIKYGKLREF